MTLFTHSSSFASLLVYIEPCLLYPLALWLLPLMFGLSGVWAAYPIAQLALTVLCVALYLRIERRSAVCSCPVEDTPSC